MFMPILSGLVVSIDAFFIGISLGLQKKCTFAHLAAINAFLFVLCIFGFLLAGQIYESIPFDPDLIVGFAFIALGLWTILQYFVFAYIKTIVLVGFIMSLEAMLITMGITFIFLPYSGFVIPVTVALAHFVSSALSFGLARTKHVKRVSPAVSHVVSGLSLIVYGLFAIFVDFGM